MEIHRVVGLLVAAGLAAHGGAASAGPRYGRPIDTAKDALADLREKLAWHARGKGISNPQAVVDALMADDLSMYSYAGRCPGLVVDVLNPTPTTRWNIAATIEQEHGAKHRKDVLHLPYLLANSMARIVLPCVQDEHEYSPLGGSPEILPSLRVTSERRLDAALRAMATTTTEWVRNRTQIEPSSARGLPTVLEAALAQNDGQVAHELVMAIARTGVGGKELGAALPGSAALAKEIKQAMPALPAGLRATLARSLLASPSATQWEAQLGPMIDGPLCSTPRAAALELWLASGTDDGIPATSLRKRVRERCKPRDSEGPELISALRGAPTQVDRVIDSVEPAVFASVVAAWHRNLGEPANVIVAYLRNSENAERFASVAATLPPAGVAAALAEVVKATGAAATPAKAAWVVASLDRVTDPAAAVAALTRQLFDGEIIEPVMRDAARHAGAKAADAATDVILKIADQRSLVFDARKLAAHAVDLTEFLLFDAKHLRGCTDTLSHLRACASAIAAYRPPAGTAALKLAGDAVKREFVKDAMKLVSSNHDPADELAIGRELAAAGLPVGIVVEQACRDGDAAIVSGDHDPATSLAVASQLDPAVPCVAALRTAIADHARDVEVMTMIALLGLVAPLLAGGWLLRRQFRELKRDEVHATEPQIAGGSRGDRLGPRGLSADDRLLAPDPDAVSGAVRTGDAASVIAESARIKERATGDHERLTCHFCGHRELDGNSRGAVSGQREFGRERFGNTIRVLYQVGAGPVGRCERCARLHAFVRGVPVISGLAIATSIVAIALAHPVTWFRGTSTGGGVGLVCLGLALAAGLGYGARELVARAITPRGERRFDDGIKHGAPADATNATTIIVWLLVLIAATAIKIFH
jgi:hypothetical protein